jgi:hypothetical protein
MTTPLFGLLGGPVKDIISAIGGVIDDLHTSGEEKLKARSQLLELEQAFRSQVLAADVELSRQQASVISEETKHGGLAGSWRPVLMLSFTFIICWNFILGPMFGAVTLPIPPDMWDLLKLGVGGYIIGRSVEKIAPEIATAITAAKTKGG